jgi:hypothetical protein
VDLEATLLGIESALAAGGADAYRQHLADEALVVVPGTVLDREATIEAIASSPGWDVATMDDARSLRLDDDTAVLTYRFDGRRGDQAYVALLSSVYVQREGRWRMAFHQQTPLPG